MSDELQVAEPTESPEVQVEQVATEHVQTEVTQDPEQKQERETDELPRGVRKSIDRLTRQRYQAEAERDMLRRELEQIRQSQQPPKPAVQASPEAPTLEQFNGDWDKYIEAKAEYVAERKLAEREAAQSQRSAQQQAQITEQQAAQRFHAEARKAQEAYPDFIAVMEESDAPVNQVMQRAIFALGESGPDVAYHLAKNPDEAFRISQLDPFSAAAAIGRLSASVQRPAKKESKAPAPVSGVAPKAQFNVKSDDLSEREYWARRAAERNKSR